MPMRMLRTLATLAAFVPFAAPAHGQSLCAPVTFGNSIDTVFHRRSGETNHVGAVAGDFNRDGRIDLAVTDFGNRVSILSGDGAGRFLAPSHIAVADETRGITAADFNGDGALDLAIAHRLTATPAGAVSILLGTGRGTFAAPIVLAAGVGPARPVSLAAGDFNRDGRTDLVAANGSGSQWVWSTVSVFTGLGNGRFEWRAELPVGGALSDSPQGVAVADMNNDGFVDIVTSISILFGSGTGAFLPFAWLSDPETRGDALTVAHFDGDSYLDIARRRRGGALELLVNTPAGYVLAYASGAATALAAADFDGDGHDDLASVRGGHSETLGTGMGVEVRRGAGATFGDPVAFAAGVGGYDEPHGLVAADFDGDGRSDLAAFSKSHDAVAASVLLNGRCEPGGKAISVRTTQGWVDVGWMAGRSQTGYFVLRTVDGVTAVLPNSGTPLPASAIEFRDFLSASGRFNCYQVIPLGSSGPLGRSDMLCVLREALNFPFAFTARVTGTAVHLSVGPAFFADGATGTAVIAVPLDGGPARVLPPGAVWRDETGGVNTCYRAVALEGGTPIGQSDLLCAFPGRAVLGGS